jgi:hypothetical protein
VSGSDHYEVLNVERTATTAEIKSAYRKLVRQVHPDQGGNAALFRLVQEAWNTLSDDGRRAAYDRELAGQTRSTPPRPEPEYSGNTTYNPPPRDPPPRDPPRTDAPRADPPPTGPAPSEPAPSEPAPSEPQGPVRVVPRFGRWRVVSLVLLVGWLIVVIGPVLAAAVTSPKYLLYGIPLVFLAVAGLPRAWRARVPFGRLMSRAGVLVAIAFVATIVLAYSQLNTTTRVVMYVEVGGFVLVRLTTWRRSVARELDQAIDKYAAYDANVWGRPGEPLVDDGRTPPLPPSEVLRTRRTARILEGVLSALPAAKLVHSPRVGGVTIDHLLIAGSRVAVVASIIGPPGTYSIDGYGSLLRDGQPFGGNLALSSAITSWQDFLESAKVHAFLVVLPAADGQRGIIAASSGDPAVTCLAAQSAVTDLTAWLQPQGNILNRQLLYDVLYQAPNR